MILGSIGTASNQTLCMYKAYEKIKTIAVKDFLFLFYSLELLGHFTPRN